MSAAIIKSSLRPMAIRTVDVTTRWSGAQRVLEKRFGGSGCALMWHSVVDNPADYLYQDIRCSTRYLDLVLSWCRENGIAVVDMDEAMRRLTERIPGRFVVMTFDDGYRDNLTAALPVFEQYNVPIVIYPTVGLATREAYYWWGGLVELVKRADNFEIDGFGRVEATSRRQKIRALAGVNRWIEGNVAERSQALRPTFAKAGVQLRSLMNEHALTPDEIRNLSRHPLVSLGSHTISHVYLRPLSEQDARREIVDSKVWLEELTQVPIDHFAYPHGDARACGDREAIVARSAGYKTAVSTRRGNLYHSHAQAPFLLPRGAVNPRRETLASLTSQLAGVPRFIASGGRSPIDPATTAVAAES
ncbi:polysaccharide deacetylase family protein [Blastococcus sp. SYSU DS0541]